MIVVLDSLQIISDQLGSSRVKFAWHQAVTRETHDPARLPIRRIAFQMPVVAVMPHILMARFRADGALLVDDTVNHG